MAREGVNVGGEREQVPITLSTTEFIRRWCLHIQPDQLTKTRYFGGWSNNRREKYLDRCRRLLGANRIPSLRYRGEPAGMSGDVCGEDDLVVDCPKCERGVASADQRDAETVVEQVAESSARGLSRLVRSERL